MRLLGRCKQVALVQHHDDGTPAAEQRSERIELGFRDVAVDDEQHQVAAASHFLRELLTFLTACLVEARGVDEKHAARLFLPPGLHG